MRGGRAMEDGSRRRRGDDGAAAIEFALLFPIFMGLALGMIFGGMAFSKQINVTQAAREGSRFGATYDVAVAGGIDSWLIAVRDATRQAAGASNDLMGGYDYVCVAYVVTKTNASGIVEVDTPKSKFLVDNGVATAGACPSVPAALSKDTV